MGRAIEHPVSDRVEPSFVIFDIRALWRSGLSVRVPGITVFRCRRIAPGDHNYFDVSSSSNPDRSFCNVCHVLRLQLAADATATATAADPIDRRRKATMHASWHIERQMNTRRPITSDISPDRLPDLFQSSRPRSCDIHVPQHANPAPD